MPEDAGALLALYRAAIIATLPQFAGAQISLLKDGRHATTLLADGWILRLPRTDAAAERLSREAAVLGFLRPRVTMSLPQMSVEAGALPFTRHSRIDGVALTPERYAELDNGRRNAIALRLAQFYAELHALPLARMRSIGAVGAEPWMSPTAVLNGTLPRLARKHHGFVRQSVRAYRKLGIDGDELVFGYFGGHGDNMALDEKTGLLNGVFDFADAGFGSRHRDLSYSNAVSSDLTLRIVERYEALTGRKVDRQLIMLYSSILLLAELAAAEENVDDARSRVLDWIGQLGATGLAVAA